MAGEKSGLVRRDRLRLEPADQRGHDAGLGPEFLAAGHLFAAGGRLLGYFGSSLDHLGNSFGMAGLLNPA